MIQISRLGMVPYLTAWDLQERLRADRATDLIPDTLILCEHPPVFTVGRQDCRVDWLAAPETIAQAGIDVVQVNRGGRITYHGPGQLVGYFIFDLRALAIGVRAFVTMIETLLIETLASLGIEGHRDPAHPGVWVGRDKIAAIGLHISRGITQHGFALNVRTDLEHYRYIVPCGIRDRGVTSMECCLGRNTPPMTEAIDAVARVTARVFGRLLTNRQSAESGLAQQLVVCQQP
ncbi:MAG: lipoyl(octanoyl) transferase LipB [Deltaproteobacteria bacterium]|nr:lipoyl(octanoyl) transferase LipB [Deltaproteobacteria bacterium]